MRGISGRGGEIFHRDWRFAGRRGRRPLRSLRFGVLSPRDLRCEEFAGCGGWIFIWIAGFRDVGGAVPYGFEVRGAVAYGFGV